MKKLFAIASLLALTLDAFSAPVAARREELIAATNPANLRLSPFGITGSNNLTTQKVLETRSNSVALGETGRAKSRVHIRDGALWMPSAGSWNDNGGGNYYNWNQYGGQIIWKGTVGANENEPHVDDYVGAGWGVLAGFYYWGGSSAVPNGKPTILLTAPHLRIEEGYGTDGKWWNGASMTGANFGAGYGGTLTLGNEAVYGTLIINRNSIYENGANYDGALGRSKAVAFQAKGEVAGGSTTTYLAYPGIQGSAAGSTAPSQSVGGSTYYAGNLNFYSLVPIPNTTNYSTTWTDAPGLLSATMGTNSWTFYKPLNIPGQNSGISESPLRYDAYLDFDHITIGTNGPNGTGGQAYNTNGSMAVPNGFQLYDRVGSVIWFVPSHANQSAPGALPTDGLLLLQGARDLDLLFGDNGTLQIGNSGGSKQQYINFQYADSTGGGALVGFRTLLSGNTGTAAFRATHAPVNDYADLHFYTKSPVWNTAPSTGFSDAGVEVMSLNTDASSQSEVMFHKRFTQARAASSASSITLDFGAAYLQDVAAGSATITVAFSNQKAGATNITKKLFYLKSGGITVSSITWPSGISVLSEDGNDTLPTTLAALKVLRVEFESIGTTAGSVIARYSLGDDNGFAFDADAQTYFDALVAASYTPTSTEKAAINQFVLQRKSDGTWTDADQIVPLIGATAAAHSVKLKGSGTLSWTGSPTHDANGVTFNGSSQYGDTGWAPSSGPNYVQDSSRVVMVIPASSAVVSSGDYYMGAISTGTFRSALYRSSATALTVQGMNNANSTGSFVTAADEKGVAVATRSASNDEDLYFWLRTTAIGGSADGNFGTSNASTGTPAVNFALGCRNFQGSGFIDHAAYTLAGWEAGAEVTLAQALTIRDAWQTLQNSLGR